MNSTRKFKKWLDQKITQFRPPALRLCYRIFLYLISIIFVPLLTVEILLGNLPDGISVIPALLLCSFFFYFVNDMRYLIQKRLIPFLESAVVMNRIMKDYTYRTFSITILGIGLNLAFLIFNGAIAVYSRSAWFATLAAYYILLAGMRFSVLRKKWIEEKQRKKEIDGEIVIYRNISILFFLMSWVLAGAVILLKDSQGGKSYPVYATYIVAGYTFYKIILAVRNLIRTGRMNDLLLLVIRRICYVDACVSLLFLQSAMFAAFGTGTKAIQGELNSATGAVVCLMVFGMGIYGVYDAKKRHKNI